MEEPCTTALALDPPQVLLGGNADSWRSVRKPPTSDKSPCFQWDSMNTGARPYLFRVQFPVSAIPVAKTLSDVPRPAAKHLSNRFIRRADFPFLKAVENLIYRRWFHLSLLARLASSSCDWHRWPGHLEQP